MSELVGHKIVHPYDKFKPSDIPDEVVLGYIYWAEVATIQDIVDHLIVYPKKLVRAKLEKLQRRKYVQEDAFAHWGLTHYGFHTINGLCGGFDRVDE